MLKGMLICGRQYYAFDVVGEVTFGKKFGFLETGQDVNGIIKIIAGETIYLSLA